MGGGVAVQPAVCAGARRLAGSRFSAIGLLQRAPGTRCVWAEARAHTQLSHTPDVVALPVLAVNRAVPSVTIRLTCRIWPLEEKGAVAVELLPAVAALGSM